MFKKKKPEPVDVPTTETQNLEIGDKQTTEQPKKEMTLTEYVSTLTEVEYRVWILNILQSISEKVEVIENEAIQSRNQ